MPYFCVQIWSETVENIFHHMYMACLYHRRDHTAKTPEPKAAPVAAAKGKKEAGKKETPKKEEPAETP